MNLYAKRQNLFWQKLLVGAVVLVVVIFLLNLFQKQTRNAFLYFSSPVSNVFLQAGKGTSQFLGSLLSFTLLQKENSNLKTENQHLLASLASLQEAFNASQDLKTATESTASEPYHVLQAGIIGLDVAGDTMLINRGSVHGIKENMPVISKEKVLFGKVSQVYAEFSQITLISNKKSALAVKVQTLPSAEKPVYGIVKGNGNLSIYMDLINADSVIHEGETLVTSAQEGIFPKELLVGKIQSPTESAAQAFQTANIEPFFNPKTTDNVYIITDYLKK